MALTPFVRIFAPLLFLVHGLVAQSQPPPATAQAAPTRVEHGFIREHQGLRIVHLHGTARQRGHAMGELLGHDIVRLLAAEFDHRFGRREGLLNSLRNGIERLIEYPEEFLAELEGLDQGITASGADRTLAAFERDLDLLDLRLVAALDVIGMLGCSGFTVFGQGVHGGGVLTTRNFDWPFSGRHMTDDVILVVHHPEQGRAHVSVTWPGYLGAVTAINEDGVAVFLHVGSGKITLLPRPGSLPTAYAARTILAAPADKALEVAQQVLASTCPPASYITRVILPVDPADGSGPERAFETDARKVVVRAAEQACITTNHFLVREDGREAAKDSLDRYRLLEQALHERLGNGERKLSVADAWEALRSVQRGSRQFGTLHSLVFRASPWHFELRLGEPKQGGGITPAPVASRRHLVPFAVLFER